MIAPIAPAGHWPRVCCLLLMAAAVSLAPARVAAQDAVASAEAEAAREEITEAPDRITIDLRPTALLEGHDLRATVRVAPSVDNRLLSVRIDAPTFYAATERELIGEDAQRTYQFNWQKLPAGQYLIEALVTGADGRRIRGHRQFTVHGPKLDDETAQMPTRRRGGRRSGL
jgi:methionine-rich copper-binding protein CopC